VVLYTVVFSLMDVFLSPSNAAFKAQQAARAHVTALSFLGVCLPRRGGGYYGGGRGFVFIDPTDIFLIWDPRYGRHQRERADSGQMTFVEAVFSFVFGDGNPNENFEVGTFIWNHHFAGLLSCVYSIAAGSCRKGKSCRVHARKGVLVLHSAKPLQAAWMQSLCAR
jgi:hypothetical protein